MNLQQLIGATELGLVYSLLGIAACLTFRILKFSDMTIEGSFTLGGAVAGLLISQNHSPILASSLALLAGSIAGLITAYLNLHLQIKDFLASILTTTAIYSINLRIMGKPNLSLINSPSIFNDSFLGSNLIVLIPLSLFFWLLISSFLNTHLGLAIRAVGSNPKFSAAQGISSNKITLITLALSNALVALSGAFFSQLQGFSDINTGQGSVVIALASIIIGESFIKTKKIYLFLFAPILGSIAYRILIAFAIGLDFLGLHASDLKLITAILIALSLGLPTLKKYKSS